MTVPQLLEWIPTLSPKVNLLLSRLSLITSITASDGHHAWPVEQNLGEVRSFKDISKAQMEMERTYQDNQSRDRDSI